MRPGAPDRAVAGERPPWSRRRVAGALLLAAGMLLGWPAVALAALLAARLGEPLLVVVGGPCLLAVAHLLFALGGWLAGGDRLIALLRRQGNRPSTRTKRDTMPT